MSIIYCNYYMSTLCYNNIQLFKKVTIYDNIIYNSIVINKIKQLLYHNVFYMILIIIYDNTSYYENL